MKDRLNKIGWWIDGNLIWLTYLTFFIITLFAYHFIISDILGWVLIGVFFLSLLGIILYSLTWHHWHPNGSPETRREETLKSQERDKRVKPLEESRDVLNELIRNSDYQELAKVRDDLQKYIDTLNDG